MRKAVLLFCVFISVAAFAQTKKPAARPAAPAANNVYPVQEGFVDANGVLIYYMELGRGAPLMIVHSGPGASHDYFLPHLLPLARHNRLVFIDERGSGRSEKLEDVSQYTVENMADDCEAVRQALHCKISLLGHSYGGVLAQAYALKYQKNLTHLILGSTFASTSEINKYLAQMRDQMPEDARKKVEAYEKAGLFDKGLPYQHGRYPDEYAKLAWGVGYFPYLYQNHPDANYDPAASNTSTAWDLYREMWGSDGEFIIDGNLKSVEYLDRLSTIKVPTLLIAGDHDENNPQMSKEMQAKIPGSKIVIVPKSGHMTFVDQPNLFIKSVDEFLHAPTSK